MQIEVPHFSAAAEHARPPAREPKRSELLGKPGRDFSLVAKRKMTLHPLSTGVCSFSCPKNWGTSKEMAFRADFRDNPPDDPGKAAGRQVQRDIPLYVKGIYPFARKGYTPLDKRDIPLCVKGIYPFGRVVRGSSRPFRRLFRNACGVAWISRRQPLSSSRARPIRGTPRHPGHPRHPALHAPLPPSGCPGCLGCPGVRVLPPGSGPKVLVPTDSCAVRGLQLGYVLSSCHAVRHNPLGCAARSIPTCGGDFRPPPRRFMVYLPRWKGLHP